MPARRPPDDARVRIEQDFRRVEAMAARGIPRAEHAIAVQLARPDAGQIRVPDPIGALGERDADPLAGRVGRIEEAQMDGGRVLREQGEVDAGAVPRCAKGRGCAGQGIHW